MDKLHFFGRGFLTPVKIVQYITNDKYQYTVNASLIMFVLMVCSKDVEHVRLQGNPCHPFPGEG